MLLFSAVFNINFALNVDVVSCNKLLTGYIQHPCSVLAAQLLEMYFGDRLFMS